MTDIPFTRSEEDDAEAAEYVLGVQDLAERSATEVRIKREPGFAERVTAWETRLESLNDDYAPVPVPDLMPAIEARLFPQAEKPGARARVQGAFWRWISGAAVAAAMVIVGIALVPPPTPDTVAVLSTADARLTYEVRHFGDELQITRVTGVQAVPGRVHELWLIAPGAAPVSLGLLEAPELVVTYPRPPEGWTLAVSIEPEGGSPIGTPTGPVILAAEVSAET